MFGNRKKSTSKKTEKTFNITYENIKEIAPYSDDNIASQFVDSFNRYAKDFGIDTSLEAAHFIAQVAHESAGFITTTEYSGNSRRYAPWFGRGLIMLTWQENYADFYEWCVEKGLDTPEFFRESEMHKAAEFPWAFFSSVWYWHSRDLNRYANEDNVRKITRLINGGYNGLKDRIRYLNIAKDILGVKKQVVDTDEGTITEKFTVREVQEALIKHGFNISPDGIMGPNTVRAVKLFQKTKGLVNDGIIGPKTSTKLFG